MNEPRTERVDDRLWLIVRTAEGGTARVAVDRIQFIAGDPPKHPTGPHRTAIIGDRFNVAAAHPDAIIWSTIIEADGTAQSGRLDERQT